MLAVHARRCFLQTLSKASPHALVQSHKVIIIVLPQRILAFRHRQTTDQLITEKLRVTPAGWNYVVLTTPTLFRYPNPMKRPELENLLVWFKQCLPGDRSECYDARHYSWRPTDHEIINSHVINHLHNPFNLDNNKPQYINQVSGILENRKP